MIAFALDVVVLVFSFFLNGSFEKEKTEIDEAD
jgi:hypothetical protein